MVIRTYVPPKKKAVKDIKKSEEPIVVTNEFKTQSVDTDVNKVYKKKNKKTVVTSSNMVVEEPPKEETIVDEKEDIDLSEWLKDNE